MAFTASAPPPVRARLKPVPPVAPTEAATAVTRIVADSVDEQLDAAILAGHRGLVDASRNLMIDLVPAERESYRKRNAARASRHAQRSPNPDGTDMGIVASQQQNLPVGLDGRVFDLGSDPAVDPRCDAGPRAHRRWPMISRRTIRRQPAMDRAWMDGVDEAPMSIPPETTTVASLIQASTSLSILLTAAAAPAPPAKPPRPAAIASEPANASSMPEESVALSHRLPPVVMPAD